MYFKRLHSIRECDGVESPLELPAAEPVPSEPARSGQVPSDVPDLGDLPPAPLEEPSGPVVDPSHEPAPREPVEEPAPLGGAR